MATNKKPGNWKKRTLAVRAGQVRTPFQETSEALFLTSGYVYDDAEQAEAGDPVQPRELVARQGRRLVGHGGEIDAVIVAKRRHHGRYYTSKSGQCVRKSS